MDRVSAHPSEWRWGLSLFLPILLGSTALAQPPCDPLPPPSGPTVVVTPADVADLPSWVFDAEPGTTFLLQEGSYDLRQTIQVVTDGVTIRSANGDRDAVVIDGGYDPGSGYLTEELIAISASDVTVSGLTLRYAFYHPVHISGQNGVITGVRIHDVRIVDPGEQAIKVNPVGQGWVDDGIVECSEIVLTDFGRTQIRNDCYTGGIDVHAGWGWQIRGNRIEGFWCPAGLSEHGIHFWKASRDTVVEQNVILDCARGIGLGLGATGDDRSYPDNPYPGIGYLGHIDGIVRNNFIAAGHPTLFSSEYGFDTGVGLEQVRGAEILHNSIASTEIPRSSSLEWRFANTLVHVANHLATDRLLARDGAAAVLEGNADYVPLAWFEDIAAADLHLTQEASAALDAGVTLPAGACEEDLDGENRGTSPDLGADELPTIFRDGFESGDVGAWSSSLP